MFQESFIISLIPSIFITKYIFFYDKCLENPPSVKPHMQTKVLRDGKIFYWSGNLNFDQP